MEQQCKQRNDAAIELQQAEEECRKAINQSIKNYNDALVSLGKQKGIIPMFYLLVTRNSRTSCIQKTSRRI